jgi:hypothetical protein
MCKVMGSFQPELKDFFAGLVDETAVPHLLDMLAAPHMADGHVHPYSLMGVTRLYPDLARDGIDWVTAVGPIVLVVTSDGFIPKKMGYTRMAVRPAMPGFEEIAQRHAFYPMVAMYRGKLCGWFQMLLNLSLIWEDDPIRLTCPAGGDSAQPLAFHTANFRGDLEQGFTASIKMDILVSDKEQQVEVQLIYSADMKNLMAVTLSCPQQLVDIYPS